MKKQIIITALLLSSLFSFAQKLKVKKDQLFSDKIAVATFTKEKGVFTISSLDATETIVVIYEQCALTSKMYLEITNPSSAKAHDFEEKKRMKMHQLIIDKNEKKSIK